jgi:hypothetical protein
MTEDEAREQAIKLGALQPQGFWESMSANWIGNNDNRTWASTDRAQKRLELWTIAILEGRNPKRTVG